MIKVKMTLNGTRELTRNLKKVSDRVGRRHLDYALRQGSRVQSKAMKKFAPVAEKAQTHRGLAVKRGLLRKSIGIRTKKKNKVAFAIIGPRRKKFKTLIGVTKEGDSVYMNPTQYAHLMNNGHVIKRGDKVIGRFQGTRFMNRAYQSALPETMARIQESFEQRIKTAVTT